MNCSGNLVGYHKGCFRYYFHGGPAAARWKWRDSFRACQPARSPRLTPSRRKIQLLHMLAGRQRVTEDLLRPGSCELAPTSGRPGRASALTFFAAGPYSIFACASKRPASDHVELNLPEVHPAGGQGKHGWCVTGATGPGINDAWLRARRGGDERKSIHSHNPAQDPSRVCLYAEKSDHQSTRTRAWISDSFSQRHASRQRRSHSSFLWAKCETAPRSRSR